MTFHEEMYPPDDVNALRDLYAKVADLDGAVIEIGCWEGFSTCVLARECEPAIVHAVDTWKGSPGVNLEDLARQRDVFASFQENVTELTGGNVVPYRMGWRDFFEEFWHDPVRFVHIDAEHSRKEVFENIVAVRPLIVPGGVICGHDAKWTPVYEGVAEAFGSVLQVNNLWWWQRTKETADV